MTYPEAIAWLESLQPHVIRPGLERVRRLLGRLGEPQETFPSVLIAGTNGKGSVAAFLSSILRRAGYAPGVYTSPHLVRFEERIVVGDRTISEDQVAGLAREVRAAIEAEEGGGGERPTYFEATTALAFLHFSRARVPLAVLEVGMGGLYDATNVVRPLACALTPVALDHMQWLGSDLAAIARQKAGIIKPGVPVVVSPQEPAALRVILEAAAGAGAPVLSVEACDLRPAPAGEAPEFADPPVFSLATPGGGRWDRIVLALRGDHQVGNAAAAVLLSERLAGAGFDRIEPATVAAGLASARWPGRLELIPGRPDLLLDGAHNPAGCATLAAYLRRHQAGRRVTLLFGAMHDKPAGEMLRILAPLAASIVVTSIPTARGTPAEELLELASGSHSGVRAEADPLEALDFLRRAPETEALGVITGSLYLVGEVRRALRA